MLEIKKILKIGQLVHIEAMDSNDNPQRYSSRVEDLGDNIITLASPIKDRVPILLPLGSKVNVWYWDKVAVYTFRTTILDRKAEGVPVYILKAPDKVKRVQNREFVRVKAVLNVTLRYTNEQEYTKEIECKTRNISGGGIMLVINKPTDIMTGSEVFLKFNIYDKKVYSAGRVVRNYWELDSKGVEYNILGVEYTSISNEHRNIIVKYVYKKQVELRRKGLL